MLFPYTSSYLYLMRRNNGQRMPGENAADDSVTGTMGSGYSRRGSNYTPWGRIDPDRGYGDGDTDIDVNNNYGMKPWNPEAESDSEFRGYGSSGNGRRRALGAGLTALGASLLEGAGRGDYAGSLARGAAGFTQAFGSEMENSRREEAQAYQMKQQQATEQRAIREEQDRRDKAKRDAEIDDAKFAAWQEDRNRASTTRERKAAAATQLVARVQDLAAKNPNDAKLQAMASRISAYNLDDDSDLDKLANLHEQMTGEAFRDSDAEWERKKEIEDARAEISAGVRSDPRLDDQRANRQLEISQAHLNLARQRAAEGPRTKAPTPIQVYNLVEKKVSAKAEEYTARTFRKPSPEMMQKWRDEAAMETELGLQQSNYYFDENGQLIQAGGGK